MYSKNYSTKLKKVNLTQKGLKVLKMKMPKENLIAQKSEYNDMTWNYAAAYQLSQNTIFNTNTTNIDIRQRQKERDFAILDFVRFTF